MSAPFESISAPAAPLPLANIDTDKILPGEFLKTVERAGLGKVLFYPSRFDENGEPRSEFVLNKAPWDKAGVLVALENFGSGSSREHAPWALKDFGIRAVIAPSFADIFARNCVKNGILTATVDRASVDEILAIIEQPATATLNIDLPSQVITGADGKSWEFQVAKQSKMALLRGEDEISRSLEFSDEIATHFEEREQARPWIAKIELD